MLSKSLFEKFCLNFLWWCLRDNFCFWSHKIIFPTEIIYVLFTIENHLTFLCIGHLHGNWRTRSAGELGPWRSRSPGELGPDEVGPVL